MSNFTGMDDQIVRYLATNFANSAGDIDGIIQRVNAKLAETPWSGDDHTRFVQEWEAQHVPRLRAIAAVFTSTASSANHHVDAQQRASY